MKSFKQYLFESTKPYDFKIKIAGDCDDHAEDKIKSALVQYQPQSVKKVTRTPVQETLIDFPEHKNLEVTIFDLATEYPATSDQIQTLVATALNKDLGHVKVQNEQQEHEQELNHEHDEVKQGPALLNSPYPKENNQFLVGEKQKMALLKELGKESHDGEPYTEVNAQLLAKKCPSEKPKRKRSGKMANETSPIGSHQVKLPDVTTTGGL